MMHVGTRSEGYTHTPDRAGFGTSRHWSRDIGDWRYSFTLVDMPDGEVRWFVQRYDTPISEYGSDGVPVESRMRFGCYWHPHREWIFKASH